MATTKSDSSTTADSDATGAVKATAQEIQKAVDKEHEQGFAGDKVDETPRENYTVAGVTSGKKTPEFTELERQD